MHCGMWDGGAGQSCGGMGGRRWVLEENGAKSGVDWRLRQNTDDHHDH